MFYTIQVRILPFPEHFLSVFLVKSDKTPPVRRRKRHKLPTRTRTTKRIPTMLQSQPTLVYSQNFSFLTENNCRVIPLTVRLVVKTVTRCNDKKKMKN